MAGRTRSGARRALLAAVLLAYAAVTATFDAFTWPIRVATSLPIAFVLAWAVRGGWHRRGPIDQEAPLHDPTAPRVAAVFLWVVLLAVAGLFQVALYLSQPREAYPTLSSLAGAAFGAWLPIRFAACVGWLALGAYLLVRR